ncbi:MAG: site-specific integrase [Paludibacteraceae bacterium]|nr:site-specific integrase [Paludibacteraceae bacterium]
MLSKKFSESLNFLPARYVKNKDGKFITYRCLNPETQKMQRIKIRVNKIFKNSPDVSTAKRQVGAIVTEINCKLFAGFNPFVSVENSVRYTKIPVVVELFLKQKAKELRTASLRSYVSFSSIFLNWCNSYASGMYIANFTRVMAVRFLDYVAGVRNVSARSYNNYAKFCTVFFGWCVERGYIDKNPFDGIKRKRKEEKRRVLVDTETRGRLVRYLAGNCPGFLVVCMLVYSSLIRPKEIRAIQVRNIDLENLVIEVPGSVAKNHKTRFAVITPDLARLIANMVRGKSPEFYLVGENFECCKAISFERQYSRYWSKLRQVLGMPSEMQLYSLRDTGIFEMLKSGVDDLTVMQLADHSSLEITSIYARHKDPHLVENYLRNAPKF